MKNLYARIVLWLIGPALRLRKGQGVTVVIDRDIEPRADSEFIRRAMAEAKDAAVAAIRRSAQRGRPIDPR